MKQSVVKKLPEVRSLPSQEGSGLKRLSHMRHANRMESSLARGKWIEATVCVRFPAIFLMSSLARGKWIEALCLRPPASLQPSLPSQEGSGLKLYICHAPRLLSCLPSQEGSGLKQKRIWIRRPHRLSSLARGKWIEANKSRSPFFMPSYVFPRKREE